MVSPESSESYKSGKIIGENYKKLSPEQKKAVKFFIFGPIFPIILFFVVACDDGQVNQKSSPSTTASPKSNSEAQASKINPKIRVTADKILSDFDSNALRARSTYSDGVEIVGIFGNAEPHMFDKTKIEISVKGTSNLLGVRALMDGKFKGDVVNFDAGRLVTIKCADLGDSTITVIFNRCEGLSYFPLNDEPATIVYQKLMLEDLKKGIQKN
jgi:hypothetical protein